MPGASHLVGRGPLFSGRVAGYTTIMAHTPPARESPAERLDRNWNELLQELRVTQTGIQVLTGFLLTVPFSSRFDTLSTLQENAYLAVLTGAILSTALILSPAAYHRVLFRQGQRSWLVASANRIALAGLGMVALTTAGVAFLVFDVVAGLLAGLLAGTVALMVFGVLWVVVPLGVPRVSTVTPPGTAPGRTNAR
jgi:hypothetical protein